MCVCGWCVCVCRRVLSPRFGDTFEITNVEGRNHILFHTGNFLEDTNGCVLLGSKFGGTFMIGESKKAFNYFMSRLSGTDSFQLYIKDEIDDAQYS